MLYVIFGFKFDIQLNFFCERCSKKPIKNYQVENAILRRDFNLGGLVPFFMLSP
jgi:hypothetical protein